MTMVMRSHADRITGPATQTPHCDAIPPPSVKLPAFLFLLALAVRVAWILAVPSRPVGDFAMYLESARHLLEHGSFDDHFVYMPGYVLMAAAVQWLGGGWLAVKLTVAALAASGAPIVYGITQRLWGTTTDRRSAALAGVLYALWPGGVAVSSVTGTDVPSSIMIAAGAYALVQARADAPHKASIAAGVLFGLASWIRAVALPLIPLGGLFLWARTRSLKRATQATALATVAAIVVLSPWAVRNRVRYGEWFASDSHGGLTALVGAYPNSDGQYTRALNRTYETVTGRQWLAEPHRQADKAAYVEARRWSRFEPSFALGLAMARVDKLLSNERSLLYWPLYRVSVLKDPQRAFFERWRTEIELATDAVWWLLLWGCLTAIPISLFLRKPETLGLLPLQIALTAVYVLYFAESRYHLAIAVLAFPAMAGTVVCVSDGLAGFIALLRKRTVDARWATQTRALLLAMGITVVLACLWTPFVTASKHLLDRHRWAVNACRIDGTSNYCLWKRSDKDGATDSPVKGVFDGVGLAAVDNAAVAAHTDLQLHNAAYVVSGKLRLQWQGAVPATPPQGVAIVKINSNERQQIPLKALFQSQEGVAFKERFHSLGTTRVELSLVPNPGQDLAGMRLWLLGLEMNSHE